MQNIIIYRRNKNYFIADKNNFDSNNSENFEIWNVQTEENVQIPEYRSDKILLRREVIESEIKKVIENMKLWG